MKFLHVETTTLGTLTTEREEFPDLLAGGECIFKAGFIISKCSQYAWHSRYTKIAATAWSHHVKFYGYKKNELVSKIVLTDATWNTPNCIQQL